MDDYLNIDEKKSEITWSFPKYTVAALIDRINKEERSIYELYKNMFLEFELTLYKSGKDDVLKQVSNVSDLRNCYIGVRISVPKINAHLNGNFTTTATCSSFLDSNDFGSNIKDTRLFVYSKVDTLNPFTKNPSIVINFDYKCEESKHAKFTAAAYDDCNLFIGRKEFKFNRIVVSSASPFVRKYLENPKDFDLTSLSSDGFRRALNYMYKEIIDISCETGYPWLQRHDEFDDMLINLLTTSIKLDVPELTRKCYKIFKYTMLNDNLVNRFKMSNLLGLDELNKICRQYIEDIPSKDKSDDFIAKCVDMPVEKINTLRPFFV